MSLTWITGERISLIIQGPIGEPDAFADRVAAARAAMPRAEIIVSTWIGSPIDPAWPVDQVALSDDPGAIYIDSVINTPNNIVRQARSAAAGVALATRPFCAKLRTDFSFTASVLPVGPTIAQDAPWRVFHRPLTIAAAGTRDPYTSSMPVHPSDFFSFGLRDDVARLWAFEREPLSVTRPFISPWERLRVWRYGVVTGRFVPEQELALSLIRRSGYPDLADRVRHLYATDPETRGATMAFLQTNFRALPFDRLGLRPPARLEANVGLHLGNVAFDSTNGTIDRSPVDDYAAIRRRQAVQTAAMLAGIMLGPKGPKKVYRLLARVRAKVGRRVD